MAEKVRRPCRFCMSEDKMAKAEAKPLVAACGEIFNRSILPHPHPGKSNIEACMACGEKRLSHTETDQEKQSNRQKQPPSPAVFWKF